MLRKYAHSRTVSQNIRLGGLTAFSAGMVNVASVIAFFAFTSNVTGHYALFAEELARGHWHQAGVTLLWLFLFFFGSFLSNLTIINSGKLNNYATHSIPLIIEILCLVFVGFYGAYYYTETLFETEVLVAVLLFAMGIQNGLTASISNGLVKTTHLTGLTTDFAISLSMYTQSKFRRDNKVRDRIRLLGAIGASYVTGGVFSGLIFLRIGFKVFFIIIIILAIVLFYDLSSLAITRLQRKRKPERVARSHKRLPGDDIEDGQSVNE